MRVLAIQTLMFGITGGVIACSANEPPAPLGDADASYDPQKPDTSYYGDVVVKIKDAGALTDGAAPTEVFDYQDTCGQGRLPTWHFFDFETHTPSDSALIFSAQTANTESDLDRATSVPLATVRGADIAIWEGVDVDMQLATINEKSGHWLRVVVVFENSSQDAGAPVLVAARQSYDCYLAQ